MRALLALLLLSMFVAAQQAPSPEVSAPRSVSDAAAPVDPRATPAPSPIVHSTSASSPGLNAYTLAAGTRIPVTLKHAITTRNARENDPVYAETSFPVVAEGRIVIPAGTYVQGVIQRSQRAGRIKRRAELVIRFNSLIFLSGYILPIPGSIDRVPGAERTEIKDAGIVASGAGIGAALGGLAARSAGGADLGGLLGAGVGVASILLTRGPDARIESGTLVEMVLASPIIVEDERAARN